MRQLALQNSDLTPHSLIISRQFLNVLGHCEELGQSGRDLCVEHCEVL